MPIIIDDADERRHVVYRRAHAATMLPLLRHTLRFFQRFHYFHFAAIRHAELAAMLRCRL